MTLKHVYEIARVKAQDDAFALQDVPLSSVVRSIIGSARSLGIRVVKECVSWEGARGGEGLENSGLWGKAERAHYSGRVSF